MRIFQMLLALCLVSLVGCASYSEEEKSEFDKKIEAYARKKGLKIQKSDSGLFIQTKIKGTGAQVQITDSVLVAYTLELINGKKVDSQEKPIYFSLRGNNNVIQGWKEALIGRRVGEEFTAIIPPHLGYGIYEISGVPKNSILIYQIKIYGIK